MAFWFGTTIFSYTYTGTRDDKGGPTVTPTFNSEYNDYVLNATDNGDGTVRVDVLSTALGYDIGYDYDTIYYDSLVLPSKISFKSLSTITKIQFYSSMESRFTENGLAYTVGGFTDMSEMFYNCSSLTSIEGLGYLDTSNVTNMKSIFMDCESLTSLDLSTFDTSKVTNMDSMFVRCSGLTSLDLNSWNTGSVTSMRTAFSNCINLQSLNIKDWNVEKVTGMSNMFNNCNKLTSLDLSSWNTLELRDMQSMFASCRSLNDLRLDNWNASKITSFYNAFKSCSSLTSLDLSHFNVSVANDIDYMFYECSSLTSLNLNGWNTSGLTGSNLFYNCSSLQSLYLSGWDVQSMGWRLNNSFSGCNSLNYLDLTNCTSTNINTLISYLPTKTSDNPGQLKMTDTTGVNVSSANSKYWNIRTPMTIAEYKFTSSVDTLPVFNEGFEYSYSDIDNNDGTTTRSIKSDDLPTSVSFRDKTGLISLDMLATDNITTMEAMFYNCTNLESVNTSDWNLEGTTTIRCIFYNCTKLTSIDVSNWDTSDVTNIYGAFYNCKNLEEIDVCNWQTQNVTNAQYVFWWCEKLERIDVSSWNLENATAIEGIFGYCHKLSYLDVSNWYLPKVTMMRYVFTDCWLLDYLDLSNWRIKGGNMYGIFHSCFALQELYMDNWDQSGSGAQNMKFLLWGCESLTTLSIKNWKFNANVALNDSLTGCTSLRNVLLGETDAFSVNKIIENVPARTLDSPGVIEVTNIASLTGVNTTTANSKYWNVAAPIPIIEYVFISNIDTLPIFNDDFSYTYIDVIDGDKTIRTIYASFLPTNVSFNDRIGLVSLNMLKTDNITTMANMFQNCINLISVDANDWNTAKVINTTNMFAGCENLININVNGCSVKTVTDIAYALYDRSELNESGILIMDLLYEDFIGIYNYVKNINWNIPLDNYIDNMIYNINISYCNKCLIIPKFNKKVGK